MAINPAPQTTLKLGILGGTFDPIHIGHLIIAEESRYRFGLDKVVFVPAGTPPHKPIQPSAGREDRFRMTVLATEDNPSFEVSRVEIDRPGPSYAVDTLTEFKKIYGNETRLFFIIGADAILEILTWHEPEKLLDICWFIAVTRPGYSLRNVARRLPKEYLEQTTFLKAPGVNVSATELRSRVASGMPIKYLVPQTVEEYITENRLYRSEK